MFLERLLNSGNTPLLEQQLQFTVRRHELIAENIANISTPGYRQKDLSLEKFQALLRDRLQARRGAPAGSVRFDDIRMDTEHPMRGILFHDGANRSVEHLMSDLSKNAMMHNLAVELLRKQYQSMEAALKERVA